MQVKEEDITIIGRVLCDPKRDLPSRFRALFTLRNIGGSKAISQINNCFNDSSALLKHECAFCLGQMQDQDAIPVLISTHATKSELPNYLSSNSLLEDENQEPIVRHEAGEALGAIGVHSEELLSLLQKYCNHPIREIADTCHLAVNRIQWLKTHGAKENLSNNPFNSIDPAPPCKEDNVSKLYSILTNADEDLFNRYRAMFSLRNMATDKSVKALAAALDVEGALIKHEIAYVLGQMQHQAAVESLTKHLQDSTEHAMVRHECAEALGSIATEACFELLRKYISDSEPLVRESCIVALDMCEYEQNHDFQYANTLTNLKESTV
ncbi:Deoxyhypusine hydroxylase [Trichoplax sp. H2]|nr:Deoxyhypusine hydroxylase [Trichoplax sp. H2]|eukprot:RDD46596.1 Deoxyhypusine hydroxylase [Trichoplax sp. H2]